MASVVYSFHSSSILQHVPLCSCGPFCAHGWDMLQQAICCYKDLTGHLHLMQIPCNWLCHADHKQTTWLGQSYFGAQWRRLIDFNQVFSAACLNGGLLGNINTAAPGCHAGDQFVIHVLHPGTVIAYVRLKEHQTAKQVNCDTVRGNDCSADRISHCCLDMQYRIFQSQFKIYKPSDLTQDRKQNKKRRSEPKKRR